MRSCRMKHVHGMRGGRKNWSYSTITPVSFEVGDYRDEDCIGRLRLLARSESHRRLCLVAHHCLEGVTTIKSAENNRNGASKFDIERESCLRLDLAKSRSMFSSRFGYRRRGVHEKFTFAI